MAALDLQVRAEVINVGEAPNTHRQLCWYEADCPWCGEPCRWYQLGFDERGPYSYDIRCDCWQESGNILAP